MANIYVSGLINTETNVQIRQFPIPYYPIDYPFFGVQTAVSGVAYNLTKALHTLGDRVRLASFLGNDLPSQLILEQLHRDGLETGLIRRELAQTPASVVLHDPQGKRQIYCDLKDIQEKTYLPDPACLAEADIVAACNINFNRTLVKEAARMGKTIATDVHILSNVEDDYNRDFLERAQIVFLSDEGLGCQEREFLYRLKERYPVEILVLGRGSRGALMYQRRGDQWHDLPCVKSDRVVNTVGAGDALFSSFLHFYAKGLEPVEALWNAQVFASAKIETGGAAQGFITEEEVLRRRSSL